MSLRTLTLPELQSARRMLRAGARHVEIARRLDLAVTTISRIAADEERREPDDPDTSGLDLPEDDPPPDYAAHNLRRCPTCGGMVYLWPCLGCRLIEQGTAPVIVPVKST